MNPRYKIKQSVFCRRSWLCFLVLLVVPAFTGCEIMKSLLFDREPTAFERDIEFRGPGSQEAWLEATGGQYNGNLPRE